MSASKSMLGDRPYSPPPDFTPGYEAVCRDGCKSRRPEVDENGTSWVCEEPVPECWKEADK